jgi:hypothetical protein
MSTGWDAIYWAALQLRRVGLNNQLTTSSPNMASEVMPNVLPIIAIFNARKELGKYATYRTLSLLCRHRAAQATDPRDRIYGLYGLSPQGFQELGIQPRYDIEVDTLYHEVAMTVLKTSRALDLLSVPRASAQQASASKHLPSWVPDWKQYTAVNSLLGLEDEDVYFGKFHATDASAWEPRFSPDLQLLSVEGYCVDIITKSILMKPSEDALGVENGLSYWEYAKAFSKRLKEQEGLLRAIDKVTKATSKRAYPKRGYPVCADDTRLEVLHLTMIGGVVYDGWLEDEVRFHTHRRTRLVTGWLYPLSHIFPIHLLVFLAATAKENFGAKFDARPRQAVLRPDMEFAGYDKSVGRQIFRTKNGYMGLGPPIAAAGDKIVLCKGGRLPLVLRKKGAYWELMGDCFIYGMKNGEMWDEAKCKPMWIQ